MSINFTHKSHVLQLRGIFAHKSYKIDKLELFCPKGKIPALSERATAGTLAEHSEIQLGIGIDSSHTYNQTFLICIGVQLILYSFSFFS